MIGGCDKPGLWDSENLWDEESLRSIDGLRDGERDPAEWSAMIRRTIAIVRKIQCPDVEKTQAAKESGLVRILRRTGNTHRPAARPKMGNPSKYKIGDT